MQCCVCFFCKTIRIGRGVVENDNGSQSGASLQREAVTQESSALNGDYFHIVCILAKDRHIVAH